MRLLAVIALVLAVSATAAAAQPPGQWLSDYVSSHAAPHDRQVFVGAAIQGGHTAVVNGVAVVRAANFELITSYRRRTAAAQFAAVRLCQVAARGLVTRPRLAAEVGELWVFAKQLPNGVSPALAQLNARGVCLPSTSYAVTNFR